MTFDYEANIYTHNLELLIIVCLLPYMKWVQREKISKKHMFALWRP